MSRTYFHKPRNEHKEDHFEEKFRIKRMGVQKLNLLKLEATTSFLMAFRKSKIDDFIDKNINKNDDKNFLD